MLLSLTFDDPVSPVSSVSWAPDGKHIALGMSNSCVHLWDITSNRSLRTLEGIHQSRVGYLSWNGGILTAGGMDVNIVNNDVRIGSHIVQKYRGYHMEVCGLKWSGSGNKLASGDNQFTTECFFTIDCLELDECSASYYVHKLFFQRAYNCFNTCCLLISGICHQILEVDHYFTGDIRSKISCS